MKQAPGIDTSLLQNIQTSNTYLREDNSKGTLKLKILHNIANTSNNKLFHEINSD